jgi:hypothetical protein
MTNKAQSEALERARNGHSVYNWSTIFAGFEAKGIPINEIKPRENVFTFNAWRALGRTVRRGEHGVKVETWVEREVTDPDDPEKHYQTRHHRRTTVFHISQTELLHSEFPQQRDLPPDNSGK